MPQASTSPLPQKTSWKFITGIKKLGKTLEISLNSNYQRFALTMLNLLHYIYYFICYVFSITLLTFLSFFCYYLSYNHKDLRMFIGLWLWSISRFDMTCLAGNANTWRLQVRMIIKQAVTGVRQYKVMLPSRKSDQQPEDGQLAT